VIGERPTQLTVVDAYATETQRSFPLHLAIWVSVEIRGPSAIGQIVSSLAKRLVNSCAAASNVSHPLKY
jgi:hypothetical protein